MSRIRPHGGPDPVRGDRAAPVPQVEHRRADAQVEIEVAGTGGCGTITSAVPSNAGSLILKLARRVPAESSSSAMEVDGFLQLGLLDAAAAERR